MSTPATIVIQDAEFAEVYVHWDGDSLGPWLAEFNADFAENRPYDGEYKLAQLLRNSKRRERKYNLDKSHYTGWGVVAADSMSGEFRYFLARSGKVFVSGMSISGSIELTKENKYSHEDLD